MVPPAASSGTHPPAPPGRGSTPGFIPTSAPGQFNKGVLGGAAAAGGAPKSPHGKVKMGPSLLTSLGSSPPPSPPSGVGGEGGGGGGPWWGKWWAWGSGDGASRGKGITIALLIITCSYIYLTKGRGSNSLGTMPWSDEASEHLKSLAALWDLPLASAYSATLLAGSASPVTLAISIRQIVDSSDQAKEGGAPSAVPLGSSKTPDETPSPNAFRADGDDELLVAAAITAISLADMHCRSLLPLVISRRDEADFWEQRAAQPWRLGLETLSLPIGPQAGSRWPERSLARQVHECRRRQVSAEREAAMAYEGIGLLHSSLSQLCAADSPSSLSLATSALAATLESLDGKQESVKQKGARGRAALLRLRDCTVRAAAAGLGEARPSVGTPPNILLRKWPEVAALAALFAFAPKSARPAQAWPRLQQTARQAVEGARTLFDENLKHPLKAIKEILVDKPVSLPMEANAAASVEDLRRMVNSFNREVGRDAMGSGMRGVMNVYEQEVRKPVQGALSGRLLRAALIQVQEIKVNFETELTTVQRLMEAQQLNLQAIAMMPALAVLAITARAASKVPQWLKADPLRPRADLEHVLHGVSRALLKERASSPGSVGSLRARGKRCLLTWQAANGVEGGWMGLGRGASGGKREKEALKEDVGRLASPSMSVEQVESLINVIFRQIKR